MTGTCAARYHAILDNVSGGGGEKNKKTGDIHVDVTIIGGNKNSRNLFRVVMPHALPSCNLYLSNHGIVRN